VSSVEPLIRKEIPPIHGGRKGDGCSCDLGQKVRTVSSVEPLIGEEMLYMDGETETDAVVISDKKPGQCHL
jgi:hypothetical protein